MRDYVKFYIDGKWVSPADSKTLDVINPANEEVAGRIGLGTAADVDAAVKAARRAFASFSQSTREQRLDILGRILAEYKHRYTDIAQAITEEMGAPAKMSQQMQAGTGVGHLQTAIAVLKDYKFEEARGKNLIAKEPIGVCAMITPWNWPINQIVCKVAPAIAAGCAMVLKPSEVAPFSAYIWTEVLDKAGVPAGVYNMVNGLGPIVGAALASHPGIDMVSFTGSTRAGIEVAKNAAPTIKRVCQELGGKSPNIVLDDADLQRAVTWNVRSVMLNSGQSCNAPTRMLVPKNRRNEAAAIAKEVAEKVKVGDPVDGADMGPISYEGQWNKVQGLLKKGVEEGATLVTGGPGKPQGLEKGYYVKPTIFANVTNNMTIAREEIFGPVLSILGYDSEEQAIEIGNDTPYGLAAYVQGGDISRARKVASRLSAGQVSINGAGGDFSVPFGGYKQSGNGREWGEFGLDEYLEVKAVVGYAPAD